MAVCGIVGVSMIYSELSHYLLVLVEEVFVTGTYCPVLYVSNSAADQRV